MPRRSGVGRSGRARSAGRESIRALILFLGRDTRQEDVEGSPTQSGKSPSIQRILSYISFDMTTPLQAEILRHSGVGRSGRAQSAGGIQAFLP